MAEVQDDEQWLYGDEKDKDSAKPQDPHNKENSVPPSQAEKGVTPAPAESEKEKKDADDKDGEDSSSDEDGPTVTIGKLVKQPDVVRPPMAAHRVAPAPTGLKDDDFSGPGKVNNTPVSDLSMAEIEEKPWRKPGSDLSDYFNYGFREETWTKYCDRQKVMRTESGAGMGGLGMGNKMINNPSALGHQQRRYGGYHDRNGDDRNSFSKAGGNTIQVMTAERRVYTQKSTFDRPPPNRDYSQQSSGYGAPPPVYNNYQDHQNQPPNNSGYPPPQTNIGQHGPPQYPNQPQQYDNQPPGPPASDWNMPPPAFPPNDGGNGPPQRFPPNDGGNRPPQQFPPNDGRGGPPQQFQPNDGGNRPPQQFPPNDGGNRPPQQFPPNDGGNRPPQQFAPNDGGNRPPQQFSPHDGGNRPPQQFAPNDGGNQPPQQFPPIDGGPGPLAPIANTPVPTLSQVPIFEGDLSGVRVKEEIDERSQPLDRKGRRRSRSRSRTRRSRSTSRSRRRRSHSRSPSHRSHRKRSKREREDD